MCISSTSASIYQKIITNRILYYCIVHLKIVGVREVREGWGGAERRGSRYCPPQCPGKPPLVAWGGGGGERRRRVVGEKGGLLSEENGEVDEEKEEVEVEDEKRQG